MFEPFNDNIFQREPQRDGHAYNKATGDGELATRADRVMRWVCKIFEAD